VLLRIRVQLAVSEAGRPATQAIVRTFHAFSVLAQHSERHSRHKTAGSKVLRLWPRSVILPIRVVQLAVSAAGRPATQAMVRTLHAFSVGPRDQPAAGTSTRGEGGSRRTWRGGCWGGGGSRTDCLLSQPREGGRGGSPASAAVGTAGRSTGMGHGQAAAGTAAAAVRRRGCAPARAVVEGPRGQRRAAPATRGSGVPRSTPTVGSATTADAWSPSGAVGRGQLPVAAAHRCLAALRRRQRGATTGRLPIRAACCAGRCQCGRGGGGRRRGEVSLVLRTSTACAAPVDGMA